MTDEKDVASGKEASKTSVKGNEETVPEKVEKSSVPVEEPEEKTEEPGSTDGNETASEVGGMESPVKPEPVDGGDKGSDRKEDPVEETSAAAGEGSPVQDEPSRKDDPGDEKEGSSDSKEEPVSVGSDQDKDGSVDEKETTGKEVTVSNGEKPSDPEPTSAENEPVLQEAEDSVDKDEAKAGSEKAEEKKDEKSGVSSSESKDDGNKESPKIEFPPIPENGSELLKDMDMPGRKEMVERLVSKHRNFVQDFQKELKSLEKPPEEIMGESEGEKEIRDAINKEVADLKEKRTSLKEDNKKLRTRFFELIRKEEVVKEHEKEVQVHQSFIEDLEWKMATEAIDIQTERRLLDELKGTMRKIRDITDGLTPEEIKVQLTEIEEKIGENLISIEELHTKMLEKVEESNVHHEKFIGAQRKVKEKESRKGWLERRIKLHSEMAIFWEGQISQAEQMDGEEVGRDLESIRKALMKVFEERDGPADRKDEGRRSSDRGDKRSRKSGPRKKLEMEGDRSDTEREDPTSESSESKNEGPKETGVDVTSTDKKDPVKDYGEASVKKGQDEEAKDTPAEKVEKEKEVS